MITTLTADKSDTIKAEGSVVTCHSETGRHVRVIRWALRGACGLIRVNSLHECLLMCLLLCPAMDVQLKEHSGVTVYLLPLPKHSLRLTVKTMNKLLESHENAKALYRSIKFWQGDKKAK